MALFEINNIRRRANEGMANFSNRGKTKSQILTESVNSFNRYKTYDIFLSHSLKDAELILGMKFTLEDMGYDVYVDWIEDPQLDRSKVNAGTAQKLRERMKTSKSLMYSTTENASDSKWMPWECGYFDGLKEKVVIAPIKSYASTYFDGQEYLNLYPYCSQNKKAYGKDELLVHKSILEYTTYDEWLKTSNSDIQWRRG